MRISQDAWEGDAQYIVKVDGVQAGGVFTARALHRAGETDAVTLNGGWGAGAHTVTVDFLNDAYSGTAETDRNLYVDGIAFNGVDHSGLARVQYSGGAQDYAFS